MRREDGSAVLSVLGVVLALLLIGGASLGLSQRRLGTSGTERDAARAGAAADAAADVAGLRMNRTLVSAGGSGLIGLPADTLRTVGCLSLSAGGQVIIEPAPTGAEFCPQTAEEDLGDGARFSYAIGTQVQAGGGPDAALVRRRVVAVGRAGTQVRRLLVTYVLDLDAETPTRLFRRGGYVVCTALARPERADTGCPDPQRSG